MSNSNDCSTTSSVEDSAAVVKMKVVSIRRYHIDGLVMNMTLKDRSPRMKLGAVSGADGIMANDAIAVAEGG